jgi:hypothetical protein
MPDSVKTIGSCAFLWCSNLTSVEIPKSVTAISDYAFIYCDGITDVYYSGTEEEWAAIAIGKHNDPILNATLHFNSNPEDKLTTEPTTQPVETTTQVTETTTKVEETTVPATEPSTTKPVEVPATTNPVETTTQITETTTKVEETTTKVEETTTKVEETTVPVTEPSTTNPVEVPTTTKPVVTEPSTTKPSVESATKPTTEPTTKPVVEEEIIKKPSTSTVKYGETLILHADFANVPDDAKIEWSVDGKGVTIVPSEDGKTCAVTSTATGEVTITAKYTDANGVEHVSKQEIKSNASFWQKIVSFFKNLFGFSRIIEQVIKF